MRWPFKKALTQISRDEAKARLLQGGSVQDFGPIHFKCVAHVVRGNPRKTLERGTDEARKHPLKPRSSQALASRHVPRGTNDIITLLDFLIHLLNGVGVIGRVRHQYHGDRRVHLLESRPQGVSDPTRPLA